MKCLSLVCVKLFLGNLFEISYSGKTRVFFKKEECEEDGLERERVRRPGDLQFFNSPWQNSFLMVLLIGQIPQQTNSYRGPQRTLVARTLAWLIGTHEPSQRSLLMGPRWPWTKPVNGQCPPRSQDHKVRWTFWLVKLPLLTPPPPPQGLYNFGKGFRRACKRVTGRGLGLYSGGLITRTKKQFQYKLEAGLISVGIIALCIFFTGRFSYN